MLAAACLVVSLDTAAMEVRFLLVPAAVFESGGVSKDDVLPSGTVRVYRKGDYSPTLEFPLNESQRIPQGSWHWIAEAPGYVTVGSGTITVEESTDATKQVVWPAVPACEVVLDGGDDGWRGVGRVDFASPPYGAVYPVDPGARRSLQLPAGPLVVYTVGSRGLLGIGLVESCSRGETVRLGAPSPPGAGRQAFMVHVVLPERGEGGEEADREEFPDREELDVFLANGRGETRAPEAALWSDRRGTVFFLDVPAQDRWSLEVRHPALRSRVEPLDSEARSAREVGPLNLRPRRDLEIDVSYLPARPHEVEILEALHCGSARNPRVHSMDGCTRVARVPLTEGFHTYRLENLDDGRYVVSARIDDEVIHGMGDGFFPFLDPGSEAPPAGGRFVLREEEVHGRILVDGTAVPGVVRLEPRVDGWPSRAFPTDGELRYHLYYFGRRPFGVFRQPGDEDRPAEQTAGLYYFYRIHVCRETGGCLHLNPDSYLRGSGELDFELGRGGRLEVQVAAATGEPLVGAAVRTMEPARRLLFDHGEVRWEEVPSGDAVTAFIGGEGRVLFTGLEPGEVPLMVERSGFRTHRGRVRILDGETTRAEVTLSTRRSTAGAARLLLPGDRPLARAVLLGFDAEGRRRPCALLSDGEGRVSVDGRCRQVRHLVLLHRAAAIQILDAADLRGGRELVVRQPSRRPLRVRFVDPEGTPLPGIPVELHFDDLVVGQVELSQALSLGRHALFQRSDDNGELVLRGVDPHAVEVPELVPILDGADATPLLGYRAGETIELVLEPAD